MNPNPCFFVHKQVQFGKYLLEIDVRILQCRTTDHHTAPRSWDWFQQPQYEEFLRLLSAVIGTQLSKLVSAPTKQKSKSQPEYDILTGDIIMVAYCIRDSGRSQRSVLQANNVFGLSYQKLVYLAKKMILSVRQLQPPAHPDPLNQTIKVSPYFTTTSSTVKMEPTDPATGAAEPSPTAPVQLESAENCEPAAHQSGTRSAKSSVVWLPVSLSSTTAPSSLSSSSSDSDECALPKERRALKKIVLESKQRRLGFDGKQNRLRRHPIKDESDENVENKQPELKSVTVDLECDSPATGKRMPVMKLVKPCLKELPLDELDGLFNKYRSLLLDIYNKRVPCRRHNDFHDSGMKRRELDFQVNVGYFSDRQVHHIIGRMKMMFAPNEFQMLDYILRVLLPEFLTHLVMDFLKVSYQEAEVKMMDLSADLTDTMLVL